MSGLVKPKTIDIEDSNIAMLGSDAEKDARLAAAQTEKAWHAAGKELGLLIWRIEKFQVVEWPTDQYGEFYSGDSYIILRTYKKDPDDEKFAYDLHFWLGKDSSQDERGTAAYKTVELDDYLGTTPVQHREVQGHESELFLSYFPEMKTQEGGVDSGFKHVTPEEYRHRLLQVRAAKGRVAVREVEKTHKSLNSGDTFVLDGGKVILVWNGTGCSPHERAKASEFSNKLASDRGDADVKVFTEGDGDLKEFWDLLGGEGPVMSKAEGDEAAKANEGVVKRLFRVSDASGTMEFKKESEDKVYRGQFDTNDVFVFDAVIEIFVWVGKGSNANEKKQAMQYAQDYLTKFNRPDYLPISRLFEGGENEVFNGALDVESKAPIAAAKTASSTNVAAGKTGSNTNIAAGAPAKGKGVPPKDEPKQPEFAGFKLKSVNKPPGFGQ